MDIPDTLVAIGTQNTGQRQTKRQQQKQKNMTILHKNISTSKKCVQQHHMHR